MRKKISGETQILEDEKKVDKVKVKEEIKEIKIERHREAGSIVWGLMFIFAGVIFLLNNMGVVPWSIWNLMLQFWPLLLVFAGLNMIMGEGIVTRFILGILSLVVFVSIFAYGLRETQSPLFSLWGLDKVPWLNVFNYLKLR